MLVRTQKVPPTPDGHDRRASHYTFAWKGAVSRYDVDAIQETLEKHLPDTLRALEKEDHASVEWTFAEVAYTLSTATLRYRQKYRILRSFLVAYVAVFAILALVILVRL